MGFSGNQVLSLAIFFMVIFGTILFWRFRLPFALLGISLLLGFGLLDIPHLIEFAGLDIILFLVGIIERQGIGHITFGQWIKPGEIVSIVTLAIATPLIYIQFYL